MFGRWATPEQAEAAKLEYIAKKGSAYPWEAPKPIWTAPDGAQLCRILTDKDLTILSKNGGGCSNMHGQAARKLEIEHILTFIDELGRPSGVFYAGDVAWWGKYHPALPERLIYQVGSYTQYSSSKKYNAFMDGGGDTQNSQYYSDDVMIDGHRAHFIELHLGHGNKRDRFDLWYEQVKLPEEASNG